MIVSRQKLGVVGTRPATTPPTLVTRVIPGAAAKRRRARNVETDRGAPHPSSLLASDGRREAPRPSLLCLLEVAQVRRGLVPPGRHQQPVRAEEIVFLTEDDLVVAFRAVVLAPDRMRIRVASIGLVDRPRPRQGMVDHRD